MSDKQPRLFCAVLVRQTDRHLPGWLAWHLSLGAHHVAVIDGGTGDEVRQLMQAYQPDRPLSRRQVRLEPGLSAEARRLEMTRQALAQLRQVSGRDGNNTPDDTLSDDTLSDDWAIILDADEYLVPRSSLADIFHQATDDTAAVALHWRIHGTAGHFSTPPGHVLSNHIWHAPPAFTDHHCIRLLARLAHLPEAGMLADPLTLDLPEDRLVRSNGTPYGSGDAELLAAPWESGCIQHHICAQAHGEEELPPAMRGYYDRNEQMSTPEQQKLQAMRKLANQMRQDTLQTGLAHLQTLARQQLEELPPEETPGPAPGDHVRHETFHYDRLRPSARSTLLLNPQFSPRYSPGQAVLLRFLEGRLLECDPPDRHRPLVGFWQESTPHILTLHAQDKGAFTLGDTPCPFGHASLRINFSARKQAVYLPHETGRGNIPMEMVPAGNTPPSLFLPLPPADEAGGLSVHGLFSWLAGHADVRPQDLQRVLLLLAPEAIHQLRRLAPMLEEFLPATTVRPDFLPR